MTPTVVPLVETATGAVVAATLLPSLTPERVVAGEAQWTPHRQAAPDAAEHSHWNWALKVGLLTRPGVHCLGIEFGGEMQGMMLVDVLRHTARLDPDRGRRLVYVDFLESAPWNSRAVTPVPRYRHVGRCLLATAVVLSLGSGYGGRVGLHSLPQAEGFYESGCGMVPWSQDPGYHGLMYYEFTPGGAADFLRGGVP